MARKRTERGKDRAAQFPVRPTVGTPREGDYALLLAFLRALAREAARADHADTSPKTARISR
ncbi:hypothetical protein C8J27_1233 [Rhodobacter aestuarii]|uniref:Uncharacterized protein n=1 Tax=Rhodobacter aestuarii TaxID=453582 RepID=A0A1N7QIH4_9RHOB|nr:hypothetical protein C8J27_1233 [Rhodobacter aestuarii]SIT22731.1 hypothetical protein SAMN05421580_1252 [Rhodobacter aestuarii]